MKKRNKFLMVAITVAVILSGLTVYQYGYLRVQSEVGVLEDLVAAKRAILEKSLILIADKPRLEKKIAVLNETRKADGTKLIEGQTPSLAAASLQNSVKGLVTSRGGAISSERVEKPEDMGKFKVVTVTIDATVPDIRVLNDVLFSIETQAPYLVVQEVETRVMAYQNPKDLVVKLKISGLTGGR